MARSRTATRNIGGRPVTPAQLAEADALWDEAKARPPEDDMRAVRDAQALVDGPDPLRYWWLRD